VESEEETLREYREGSLALEGGSQVDPGVVEILGDTWTSKLKKMDDCRGHGKPSWGE
jgi:hypothetical protein